MTTDIFDVAPAQIRAARALLGWNQQELARRANVAASTVADFERGKRLPVPNNLEAMCTAFRKESVSFLPGGAVVGPAPPVEDAKLSPSGEPIRLIEASDLSQWAGRLDSKCMFPQLIHRLILVSTGNAANRFRFRATDSIQQEGWDGVCEQYSSKNNPWLPLGPSGWELATQREGIHGKAEDDYKKRTSDALELVREKSTFVFASFRTWAKAGSWEKSKRDEKKWADVRAIDADDLVHWIELYPSVGYWLASHLGKLPRGFNPLIDAWQEWRPATNWPLSPEIVLAGRDDEAMDLLKWLRTKPSVCSVQADSPDDAIAFLYASIDCLPEPHREFYLMRSVRVFDPESARTLGTSPSPLIIVMEPSEPGLATRLTEQGHHVFLAYGSAIGISEVNTVLPRATHEEFQSALLGMGVPKDDAVSLTRDSVRSLAVLRRLIPAASVKNPHWAEESKAKLLIPALLAGAWDSSVEGDRVVLEQLSGESFEVFDSQCTVLTGFPDAPLRHIGTTWKVASPRDAWFRLSKFIGRSELDRFVSVAKSVLGAADPRFEIDPDERWLAGIRGRLPEHSPWLLEGLTDTLLLLAMFGRRVTSVAGATQYADRIVDALLTDADAQRWYSLSSQFRTLAEAAPDTFLTVVENSLHRNDAPIMALFQEDGGPSLFGRANHSNLLWALETLAWSPLYLSRVGEILARLSVLDPGGKWANRPSSSLRAIFLLWMPQTNATLAERLQVLDHLRKIEPSAAWKLMLKTLPGGYDSASPTPRPRWRDFTVTKPEEVTYALIAEGAGALSERLLEDAGTDPNRCVDLIESLANLPPLWREKTFSKLAQNSTLIHDDPSRMLIWAALRRLLSSHRSFPNADWAMPESVLEEIEQIYNQFQPHDTTNQRVWLFSDSVQLVTGQTGEDWNAHTDELFAKRRAALREVLSEGGFEAMKHLAREAEKPHLVGFAYAELVSKGNEANKLLEDLTESSESAYRQFVSGLTAKLHNRFGSKWSNSFLARAKKRSWDRARIVQVLLALPSGKETWNLASSFGEATDSEYWISASVYWARDDKEQTILGVNKLLEAGRARDAVRIIAGSRESVPNELIVRMLLKAAERPVRQSNDINDPVMFQWSVCQLLQRLDQGPDVSEAQIAHLEWIYLALLEHSGRPPMVLHKTMSRDPAFFVQVLSAVYGTPSEGTAENEEIPTGVKALASQAFRLIQSWNIVPGSGEQGIDSSVLKAWTREAHQLAVHAELGAIGDQYIGRILSYCGIDADGAWPDNAVRNVIEEMKNDHLEKGLLRNIHVKRGVTRRGMLEGGAQERTIADRYEKWADAMKFESPRTATLLRRIALSFEESARRVDEHAEHTDWSY